MQLDRAVQLVEVAKEEVWADPSNPQGAVARFEPLLDDSITSWTAQLPYPVASALWTLESKSSSPKERLDQAFRVWDSYAIFLATVLLSACQQDEELEVRELGEISRILTREHLSASRATLATWRVIIDRLSSTFRTMAAKEDRDHVLQMFGDPAPSTLERILDKRTPQLLSEVNAARNAWEGHPAAYSKPEQHAQVEKLEGLLFELRKTVGPAWTDLRLLRAGVASQVAGKLYLEVELVTGNAVPFRRHRMQVGRIMETDSLFLAAEGAAMPLPLSPLVQLQAAPAEDRYTCYFYNRLESPTDARYVSYQVASESDRTTPLERGAAELLGRISGLPSGSLCWNVYG